MAKSIFEKANKAIFPSDTVEVKVFQNRTNKQFNLPVLKKHTSPQIIKDILSNENVSGFKFKIIDVIFKNKMKGVSSGSGQPFLRKGGIKNNG